MTAHGQRDAARMTVLSEHARPVQGHHGGLTAI
jgi:hypothetical protein